MDTGRVGRPMKSRGKKMRISLLIVLTLFAVSSVWQVAKADEPLSSAELKEIFPGNTVTGTTPRGATFWLYRKPNGEDITVTDSGFNAKGKYWITDSNQICAKSPKKYKGEVRCFTFYRAGKDQYKIVRPDGSEGLHTLIEGNPKNL